MPTNNRQGAPDTARRDNVETFEWLTGFVRRVIRRAGKRVADADEIELRDAAGMRKQSAQEKWGRPGERDVA